jgi:hypothetical protein
MTTGNSPSVKIQSPLYWCLNQPIMHAPAHHACTSPSCLHQAKCCQRRRRLLTIGLDRAYQHLWRAPCGRGISRLMGVCSSDSADEAEDAGYPVIGQEDARMPARAPVRTSLVPQAVPIEVSRAPLLFRRAWLLQASARRMSNPEVVKLKVRICTVCHAVTSCLV